MEPWRSAMLAREEADFARYRVGQEALEREYERLDGRGDIRAALQMKKLLPLYDAGLVDGEERQIVLKVLRETETLVNLLLPVWREKRPALVAQVEAIAASMTVPDRPSMLKLFFDDREVEHLRRVLFEVTHLPELARPYDAVAELQRTWADRYAQQQKCFSHHLSKAHRPPAPVPAWREQADRLQALQAAATAA